MDEQEFRKNAVDILLDCGLTEEQAEAVVLGTIALERSKIQQALTEEE